MAMRAVREFGGHHFEMTVSFQSVTAGYCRALTHRLAGWSTGSCRGRALALTVRAGFTATALMVSAGPAVAQEGGDAGSDTAPGASPAALIDADARAPRFDEAEQSEPRLTRPRLIGNVRLRYEFADDDQQPDNATALTVRYRGTVETNLTARLVVLGEIEAVGEIVNNFNDGRLNWSSSTPGEISDRKFRPVIADPGGVELNRIQATYQFNDRARATVGRQRIVLDDERFVGVSAFRQNDRTFDAARFSTSLGGSVIADAGYIRNVRRVIRDDAGFGFFNGDSYFVNLNVPAPAGRLALFHYAFDLETGPDTARINTASTRTTGARLEGRRYWGDTGVLWEASYARQVDFAANPLDFAVNYWLGEVGVEKRGIALLGRTEILSGDPGVAAFQTPLATLRRFQGNADVFFTTPDDGVIDRSVRAEWRLGSRGPFRDVQAFVRHHWFSGEASGDRFGNELDAELSAVYGRATFSAALARYRTRGFATNINRIFVTASYAF